jgi:hypothetical protein
LAIFIGLIIYWNGYFNIKNNLFNLFAKNGLLETSLYKAINYYDLMIFNNYTVDEIANLYLDEKDKHLPSALFRTFYNDLKNAFNKRNERSEINSVYSDFDNEITFTCEALFELNNDNLEQIKNNSKSAELNDIKGNLIKLCENNGLADFNDYTTVFEMHFQFIRNGMASLTDFTYPGMLQHFISEGTISKMSLFFNCILIYLLELAHEGPTNIGMNNLFNLLKLSVRLTEFFFLFFDIALISIILFVIINNIKRYCQQIFLLRKIFKIFEIHE